MTQIGEVLVFLKTLIQSIVDDTVQIRKGSLSNIQTCPQNAQDKIDFSQLESQLQQEELQNYSHHSEPISIQNIETGSHKQQVDSDQVPNEAAKSYADTKIQSTLPKQIIRPWEELVHNKHRIGLDMIKRFPFTFQIAQSPSNFRVLDSFMIVHLYLFRILPSTTVITNC